jgi:hypothetical protein
MPNDLRVYGIEPGRLPRIPLAHATIEEVAGSYIDGIRHRQPHGPYLLAGACGGVLLLTKWLVNWFASGRSGVFGFARSCTPSAPDRPGRLALQRRGRLIQAVADATRDLRCPLRHAWLTSGAIARKLTLRSSGKSRLRLFILPMRSSLTVNSSRSRNCSRIFLPLVFAFVKQRGRSSFRRGFAYNSPADEGKRLSAGQETELTVTSSLPDGNGGSTHD